MTRFLAVSVISKFPSIRLFYSEFYFNGHNAVRLEVKQGKKLESAGSGIVNSEIGVKDLS